MKTKKDDPISSAATLMGRKGGATNISRHGKERMKMIALMGLQARWGKGKKKDLTP